MGTRKKPVFALILTVCMLFAGASATTSAHADTTGTTSLSVEDLRDELNLLDVAGLTGVISDLLEALDIDDDILSPILSTTDLGDLPEALLGILDGSGDSPLDDDQLRTLLASLLEVVDRDVLGTILGEEFDLLPGVVSVVLGLLDTLGIDEALDYLLTTLGVNVQQLAVALANTLSLPTVIDMLTSQLGIENLIGMLGVPQLVSAIGLPELIAALGLDTLTTIIVGSPGTPGNPGTPGGSSDDRTKVTLTTLTVSKAKQFYTAKPKQRVQLSVKVSGVNSGIVTFRSGARQLATATISGGSAKAAIPAKLKPGNYKNISASFAGTSTHSPAELKSTKQFKVVKAKLAKKPKIVGKKTFTAGSRAVIRVKLSKFKQGTWPVGRVTVKVNGKSAGSKAVRKANKGKVRVTARNSATANIRVRVVFRGKKALVKKAKSKVITFRAIS